jgi:hypothetical protein
MAKLVIRKNPRTLQRLGKELGEAVYGHPAERTDRDYCSDSSSCGSETDRSIGITLKRYDTIRRRYRWLVRLESSFECALRKYKKDSIETLNATCHMDKGCLRWWQYHLKEKTPGDREAAGNNWKLPELQRLDLLPPEGRY